MVYITRNFVAGLEYRNSIRITHPRAHALFITQPIHHVVPKPSLVRNFANYPARPKSSRAGTTRIVFVWPFPPLHP